MNETSSHRQGIDLARFIAAFCVVISHSYASPTDWLGHLALALFAALAAFLAMQSAERAGGKYAHFIRARKLLLIWLVWSVFYRVVETAISDSPDRFTLVTDPWTLLQGGFIHLWFLPFLFVSTALVGPALRYLTTKDRLIWASVLLVCCSAPLFWAHEALEMPAPVPQWAFTLPSFIIGLLMARAHRIGQVRITLIAGFALTAMAIWMGQAESWTYTVLAGFLGVEVFWRLPLRARWLPHLGQVAFGIYLIHPFMMLVVYKFLGTDLGPFVGGGIDFLLSWAAIAVLRRFPLFARLS